MKRSILVRPVAIDIREFVRFVFSGAVAAFANIAITWLVRFYLPFEAALIAGITGALIISFVLSNSFAFGSSSWKGTGGEAMRFLAVYLSSSAIYWGVAVLTEHLLRFHGWEAHWTEIGGIIVAAGTMTLTSYLGHRFITYRSYQRMMTGAR
jgi:putative flippase GtrA